MEELYSVTSFPDAIEPTNSLPMSIAKMTGALNFFLSLKYLNTPGLYVTRIRGWTLISMNIQKLVFLIFILPAC